MSKAGREEYLSLFLDAGFTKEDLMNMHENEFKETLDFLKESAAEQPSKPKKTDNKRERTKKTVEKNERTEIPQETRSPEDELRKRAEEIGKNCKKTIPIDSHFTKGSQWTDDFLSNLEKSHT